MRVLLLTSLCLLASPSFAGEPGPCLDRGIRFFPAPGSVVPTNARFLLEGIGPEQEAVWALIGQELTLHAADDTITVKVLKGWRSKAGRVAVLLKPRAILKGNRTYRLELGKLAGLERINGRTGVEWSTGGTPDTAGPKWEERPNVAEGRSLEHGGGKGTRLLRLRMRAEEECPGYLVLTLRRARGATGSQTYWTPIQGEEAWIGHDACSGSFTFDDGRAYRATLEGYDCAGNPAQRLKPIEFHAPRQTAR